MPISKKTLLLFALGASVAHHSVAEEGHFSLPPSSPVARGNAGSFSGTNDQAPAGCDRNQLLSWMRSWRQKAREGYVNGVVKFMPSIYPGAKCIQQPQAFDVRYEKNGDYFIATCLAQKNGSLSHLFRMDILVTPEACLSDQRFEEYLKGTECRMPGGNQRFLNEVMKPCAITPPNSPILRGAPQAYSIDPDYFNRLLNDRPDIERIVDKSSRKVKVGATGPGAGCNNPFGCDSGPLDQDSGTSEAK